METINEDKTPLFIIAIDPGNEMSGYVIIDISKGFPGIPLHFGKVTERQLKWKIRSFYLDCLNMGISGSRVHSAIEMVASYGMAVGQTVFDTCAVIGRLEQYITEKGVDIVSRLDDNLISNNNHRVYRKKVSAEGINSVTMELCNTTRAKDTNIRQALLDLYPATGGGKTPQVGIKNKKGPLFGISKDMWSALAVGLTAQRWLEKQIKE